jgi:MFS family permease
MNNSLRLLRDRNFGPYLAGNLLSNCGTWFQNLAQSLLVYRLTKSTFMVGVVNFAQFIGMFALSPWSGSAADRFDRRRLLVVTQLGAVAVTGALMALIPLLVTPDDLGPAVALNSVSFTLARGVGPLLGALVIHELGISAAFGLNAASYLALIGALAVIQPAPQAPRPAQRPQLRDTLRVLRDDTRLAALMAVVVAVSLSQDPVSTLTPGFAKQILHHPDVYSGVLIGAFGVGSAVAGFYLASRTTHSVRRLPYTCGLMGVSMALFAVSPSLVTASVCLFFGGIGFLASNTTATTIVQLEVDDAQRGRVMALWSASFLGIRPFASLGDGGIAAAAGLRTAALVMAIPALVAAVVGGLRLRGRAGALTHPSDLEVEAGELEVETQL